MSGYKEIGLASLDIDESDRATPTKDLVKLISNDKHEFIVPREVVMASGTIKAILTGRGLWREITGPMPVIEFQEISGPVLEKIIQYFFYKKMYDKSTGNLPPFPLDTDSLLELLNAANFLDT